MTEEIQVGLAWRFAAAPPWRWEIVRPFDRYGEPMSPEFATEALARGHARRVWGFPPDGATGSIPDQEARAL